MPLYLPTSATGTGGQQGPTGPPGPKGDKGDSLSVPGPENFRITNIYVTQDGKLIVEYDKTTEE